MHKIRASFVVSATVAGLMGTGAFLAAHADTLANPQPGQSAPAPTTEPGKQGTWTPIPPNDGCGLVYTTQNGQPGSPAPQPSQPSQSAQQPSQPAPQPSQPGSQAPQPSLSAVPSPSNGQPVNGKLCVYENPNRNQGQLGIACEWDVSIDSRNWEQCPNGQNVRNKASSIVNNTGRAVRLYWDKDFNGSYACLGAGDRWEDLTQNPQKLTWREGNQGHMEAVNKNVSSHEFVDSCPK